MVFHIASDISTQLLLYYYCCDSFVWCPIGDSSLPVAQAGVSTRNAILVLDASIKYCTARLCRSVCSAGIMDNFVMLSAGDLIDNTLGVKFGLATLTAAACGQVVRNNENQLRPPRCRAPWTTTAVLYCLVRLCNSSSTVVQQACVRKYPILLAYY